MSIADHFLPGALIGLDTAPFIYHFESHPEFGGLMRAFFRECIDSGRNPAVTSVVTWRRCWYSRSHWAELISWTATAST